MRYLSSIVGYYSLFTFSLSSNHFCWSNLFIILTQIFESEMRMVIIISNFLFVVPDNQLLGNVKVNALYIAVLKLQIYRMQL